MNFPKTIRYLRKQSNLTQEELAVQLNISFQTVSKWENGVSMPDIGMLPILAEYFEISIDELLGYSSNVRAKKAAAIANKVHSMADKGLLQEACQYLEEEIRYYKLEPGLQHLLGFLAYQCAKEAVGDEKTYFLNKAVKQAEFVLRLDQNNSSRSAQARMLKCYCMLEMGNRKMAVEIAQKLPSLFSSREVVLYRCTEGKEKKEYAAILEKHLAELQQEITETKP